MHDTVSGILNLESERFLFLESHKFDVCVWDGGWSLWDLISKSKENKSCSTYIIEFSRGSFNMTIPWKLSIMQISIIITLKCAHKLRNIEQAVFWQSCQYAEFVGAGGTRSWLQRGSSEVFFIENPALSLPPPFLLSHLPSFLPFSLLHTFICSSKNFS